MRTVKYEEQNEILKQMKEEQLVEENDRQTVTSFSEITNNDENQVLPKNKEEEDRNKRRENATNKPIQLLHREGFTNWLKTFLMEHIENGKPGVAYLHGPPGVGKSSTVHCVLLMPVIRKHYRILQLNCMELKNPCRIFKKMCEILKLKTSKAAYYGALEEYLSRKPRTLLFVIDKIDSLGERKNEILHLLLTLGGPTANLVIVGMGNSELLTPALKQLLPSHTINNIMSMPISPYKKEHILNILTRKFYRKKVGVVFKSSALNMLAEKVATRSGDMRKALNLARLAMTLVSQPNGKSRVNLSDVQDLFKKLRRPSRHNFDPDEDMSLHERLMLCSILLLLPRYKSEKLIFGMVYNVYAKVAEKNLMTPVDSTDAWNLCEMLARRKALIAIRLNNQPFLQWHLRLRWDQSKTEDEMKNLSLFGSIIANGNSFFKKYPNLLRN